MISYKETDMKREWKEEIHRINYLSFEIDSLYHQAALRLGISDSVSLILYTIYDIGEGCLLSDVYKNSGVSRQTVSSAIRGLEAENILYLEPINGKSKKIVLTKKGEEYMQKTAARLFAAESAVFDDWTQEELEAYIRLMGKYTDCFKKQIEKL